MKNRATNFFASLWEAVNTFLEVECYNSAAAISFYGFFSLIPLMLLTTAFLGFVLGSQSGVLDQVIGLVKQGLPYISETVVADLKGLALKWRTFGWVAIVSLLWSAELVLNSSADALLRIFEKPGAHGFWKRRAVNLSVLFIAVAAALFSVVVTAVSGISARVQVTLFGVDLSHLLIESIGLKYVAPFLTVTVSVALVYRILSGSALNILYALYGSVVFTVLWESAKQVFALYLSYFPSYNKFYASLGTLMILLIWIYYSVSIFLFAAAFARAAYRRGAYRGRVRL